jgi:hypothetical protein
MLLLQQQSKANMQKHVTQQQHAHIVANIQRFVQQQIVQAHAANDYAALRMYVQDAAYNDKCLQAFVRDKRWDKLHNALTMQDTEPRECVFACIVESAGAAALGLTWDFVNTY